MLGLSLCWSNQPLCSKFKNGLFYIYTEMEDVLRFAALAASRLLYYRNVLPRRQRFVQQVPPRGRWQCTSSPLSCRDRSMKCALPLRIYAVPYELLLPPAEVVQSANTTQLCTPMNASRREQKQSELEDDCEKFSSYSATPPPSHNPPDFILNLIYKLSPSSML